MTEMVVNTNLEKKKLTFSSTKVAFGEKVIVLFPDLYEQIGGNIPSDLRLRVLFLGKTIARFPYNEEDAWDNAGVLKCELNLNTNIAQNIKGIVECEFILDNVDESILYGVGYKEMLPWKKEAGEDVPYNLTDYPDILNEFREDIKNNNAAQVGLIEEYNFQSDKKYNAFKSEVETDIKDFKSDVEKTEEEIEKSLNNKYSSLESRVNTSLRDYTTLAQTQNSNIDKYKEEIKNKEEEFKAKINNRVENFISETSKENSNFKNSINNNIAEFKTDVSTQVIEEIGTFKEDTDTIVDNFKNEVSTEVEEFKGDVRDVLSEQDDDIAKFESDVINALKEFKTNTNEDISQFKTMVSDKLVKYEMIEQPLQSNITLQDRAITQVIVDYSLPDITFTFPEKTEGRARDFFLRLVITSSIPTLYFVEPNGENVSFDADDDSWAAIEQGVNILMFSDTGV